MRHLLSFLILSASYMSTSIVAAESSNGDCPMNLYSYSDNLCGQIQAHLNIEYSVPDNVKDGKITCDDSKNLGIFTNEAPRVYFKDANEVLATAKDHSQTLAGEGADAK